MKNIEEFNNDILQAIEESKKIGYNPIRLIQMLQKVDGNAYQIVRELVTGKVPSGFTTLFMKGKTELTIEAIVLKHKELFPNDIIKACEQKLK